MRESVASSLPCTSWLPAADAAAAAAAAVRRRRPPDAPPRGA
ncbi:MAG: hypothetical protein ACK4ZJ_17415 [Allorhizobium sp.]